jgi:hypothetical protein
MLSVFMLICRVSLCIKSFMLVFMMNVLMLSVFIMYVIMLSVTMHNVVILSIIAAKNGEEENFKIN